MSMSSKVETISNFISKLSDDKYTGQLIINFNRGGICNPLFLNEKLTMTTSIVTIQEIPENYTDGLFGRISILLKDGKINKNMDISKEIWL